MSTYLNLELERKNNMTELNNLYNLINYKEKANINNLHISNNIINMNDNNIELLKMYTSIIPISKIKSKLLKYELKYIHNIDNNINFEEFSKLALFYLNRYTNKIDKYKFDSNMWYNSNNTKNNTIKFINTVGEFNFKNKNIKYIVKLLKNKLQYITNNVSITSKYIKVNKIIKIIIICSYIL